VPLLPLVRSQRRLRLYHARAPAPPPVPLPVHVPLPLLSHHRRRRWSRAVLTVPLTFVQPLSRTAVPATAEVPKAAPAMLALRWDGLVARTRRPHP
jgi:hypothetical protein